MPIQTQSADGVIHEFPDDTAPDVVDRAMKTYAQQTPLSWGQVGVQAAGNIPQSAARFAHDVAQPLLHPIQTAENIADVGQGALQAAGIVSGEEKIPYAKAVKDFMVQRYGGIENLKHTLAQDPVGVAGDLSVLFTGGETALARAPGIVGRVGEISGEVGRTLNPVTAPLQALKGGGSLVGALGTHTGGESVRALAKAGYQGGEAAAAARGQLRGTESLEDIVTSARAGVEQMRKDRSAAYQADMATMTDPTVLSLRGIGQALRQAGAIKQYKGVSYGAPKVDAVRDELQATIANWSALPPKDFHTVEGLDKLKQQIGEIRETTQPGTPERAMANQVYGEVRETIIKQAPQYAKIMKAYEVASDEIKKIERELSLNPNANVGTSLRKLQSVLRNNVSTAYGYRAELLDYLTKAGAPHLMERIAGAINRPWMARGLGALGQQLTMEAGAALLATGAAGATAGGGAALAMAPFMSPRLVGEAAYLGGRLASPLKYLPKQTPTALAGIARAERPLQVTVPRRGEGEEATPAAFVSRTLGRLLPEQQASQFPQLIATNPRLRGPVDDWAKAVGSYRAKWSPGAVSKVLMATRNLVNNLRDAGVELSVDDVLTAAGVRRIEDRDRQEREKTNQR